MRGEEKKKEVLECRGQKAIPFQRGVRHADPPRRARISDYTSTPNAAPIAASMPVPTENSVRVASIELADVLR